MQQCGANPNDEFEWDWSEDFPASLDSKVRPIPPRLAEVVKTEFDRLHGYFWADSDSPVCCPLTVAPKATAPFIRVAADLRLVNPYIHTPKEYIPDVKTEVMKMQRFAVFSDLDQTNSFHQIRLGYLSSRGLIVKTHLGLKRPLFVPEGVSPGSALLHQQIFAPMSDCMVVMFDNLLIGGTDFDDLQEKLLQFFTICQHHNVVCKMAKLKFGQDHANFFGYIVKQNGYELSDERKRAVNDIPFPTNLQGMQRFLGSSIFFKPFVPDYSGISSPLSDMTKGSFSWSKSTWTQDYEKAFVDLKAAMLHSLKIHFPDFNKKFILRTEASKIAVAGVLLQEDPDTGELQPVALISSKL